MRFTIEVEQEDDGHWLTELPALPGVLAYGQTREEAIARLQALALRVLTNRLGHGEAAPVLGEVFAVVACANGPLPKPVGCWPHCCGSAGALSGRSGARIGFLNVLAGLMWGGRNGPVTLRVLPLAEGCAVEAQLREGSVGCGPAAIEKQFLGGVVLPSARAGWTSGLELQRAGEMLILPPRQRQSLTGSTSLASGALPAHSLPHHYSRVTGGEGSLP
jgi:predicted RNase H-like HicB family nuclease